jgi:predicted GNAT superfamily acetyltransferase
LLTATTDLRAASEAERRALLALNNAHAVELSWLEAEPFSRLISLSFHARRVGAADAFVIALDHKADYDSPNHIWFRGRLDRFIYVDRVVVAPHARGRGLAGVLYADLFAVARRAGHDQVVCEVNSSPPNTASAAFHASLGFREIGSAAIHGGRKTVSYLSKRLI